MIHEGRVYIDTTIMKAVAACALNASVKYVAHFRSANEAIWLRAGTAVHEALATFFRMSAHGHPMRDAIDSAMMLFDTLYVPYYEKEIARGSVLEERFVPSNVRDVLIEWFARRANDLPWLWPTERNPNAAWAQAVEVGFAQALDETGRYVFFGKLDLFADHSKYGRVIVDHKTTKSIDETWRRTWRTDPQATGYYWAGLLHDPYVQGFVVNGIELSKLPSSTRKCATHALPYNECRLAHATFEVLEVKRSLEQMERWRMQALQLAQKYEWLVTQVGSDTARIAAYAPMEGPFTGACRFCNLSDWCGTGHLTRIEQLGLEKDEWNPYDPRELPVSPLKSLVGRVVG